jgi:membrane-bound metal-dependent hydrolase YbcI (DUF457 family)
MPSPAGHGIAGLAIGMAWFLPRAQGIRELANSLWRFRIQLLACIILANAPDIDYLFGIPSGNLNLYHQTATHTAAWVLLLAAVLWSAGWPEHSWRSFIFLLLLLGSHLAMDYLCEDKSKPFGMMLGWPFWPRYFLSTVSIFPAAAKSGIADLLTVHNIRVVMTEALYTLPFVVIVAAFKLAWRRKIKMKA